MSTANPCKQPIGEETLVEYWAAALDDAASDAVEEHLFGCAACTERAARIAALTEPLRAAIPPAISRERLERLRARGLAVRENAFLPGDRRDVLFPTDTELLIHHLGGLELDGAERVSLSISSEATGETMISVDGVPFERGEGAVLIACQRHYASLPHDTVFELAIALPGGVVRSARYTILHHFA